MQADAQRMLKRSRRSGLPHLLWIVPLVIVLLLAGGWSLFWYLAAQQTETLLQAWMIREKSVDRIWNCPEREISGFPFKIEITCNMASFAGEILGNQLAGNVKAFHATASLFHPDRVDVLAVSPFNLRSNDGGGEVALTWDTMRVQLSGLPQDLLSLTVDGTNVELRGGLKGFGALNGRAGSLNSTVNAVASRQAEDAYAFHLALENSSLPSVDSLLGSQPPDSIHIDGIVTKVDFRLPGTAAERLERWRVAGGRLELTEAGITRGTTRIAARGLVQLDDLHRPLARLDAEFAGAEPLLQRYGINPALVGAGSLLTALLGGKGNSAPSPSQGPPALHLPVMLQSGLVAVGPVKTNIAVPPLY